MANTLFITISSLPLYSGDNISFKYNGGSTTRTIVFGSGGGQCPVATSTTQQASNLVTFINTNYPDLACPSTTTNVVIVSAVNGSNITTPLQPNLAPFEPEVTYQYVTTNQDPPQINSTSGTLPTTIGAGTQIRMNCYWRYYYRDKIVTWGGFYCVDRDHTNSPSQMGTDASPILFTLTGDTTTAAAFTNTVYLNSAFSSFASVAFNQYSIDTSTNKFKFKMNGVSNGNGSCSTTHVQQTVKIRIKRKPPGGNFATFNLTGDDVRSGEGVQILLNTPEKVALFLSTDFLDLGGINNQVAYSNPILMNYDNDTTTPGPSNNTIVLLCKSSTTGGNPINSYDFGYGSDLDWTWWNKSFLVRDSAASDPIYSNLLYLVNQQVNTGTVEPGTKSLG